MIDIVNKLNPIGSLLAYQTKVREIKKLSDFKIPASGMHKNIIYLTHSLKQNLKPNWISKFIIKLCEAI